jgi:DNA (cytosine-5)-methyltransferase 1
MIPIIDIFAGPGGLGEGFSSLNIEGIRAFKIALSIEKDRNAHQTLTLRSFFRQFEAGNVPQDYYEFVKGNITLEDLYEKYPEEAAHAINETWLATLGESENAVSAEIVDDRILKALKGEKNWLLIGGPPCQAYSVVGRVRRQQNILDESKDERVGLYKQYLRILAVHNPAVFVMENVKGLLSATTKKSPVFSKILEDLSNPVTSSYLD